MLPWSSVCDDGDGSGPVQCRVPLGRGHCSRRACRRVFVRKCGAGEVQGVGTRVPSRLEGVRRDGVVRGPGDLETL